MSGPASEYCETWGLATQLQPKAHGFCLRRIHRSFPAYEGACGYFFCSGKVSRLAFDSMVFIANDTN